MSFYRTTCEQRLKLHVVLWKDMRKRHCSLAVLLNHLRKEPETACLSVERHANKTLFAGRSTRRHSEKIEHACRSVEHHEKTTVFACHSTERRAKRARKCMSVCGTTCKNGPVRMSFYRTTCEKSPKMHVVLWSDMHFKGLHHMARTERRVWVGWAHLA